MLARLNNNTCSLLAGKYADRAFGGLMFPKLTSAGTVHLGVDERSVGRLPSVSGSLLPLTILDTLMIG